MHINVVGAGADAAARITNRNDEQAIFKKYAPFTDCITEINNTEVDNAKDLDVFMLIYNLSKYSDNCSRTSGSLYPFYRDESNDDNITESEWFKFKSKLLDNTNNAGIINAKIVAPLKYLNNF